MVDIQIDKLATDVVMQAATGSYKPVSLMDNSAAVEPMDTDIEQHDAASAEQSVISSSCVSCTICHFMQ